MVHGRQRCSDVLEPLRVGDDRGPGEHFVRPIPLKALVRVAGDAAAKLRAPLAASASSETESALAKRFASWSELVAEFRRDGFYERFPARGQVERVEKIRARLVRESGL